MNWGNKLVLVFVGFASLMATLVYKSTHTRYELVSKDYYNQELLYQDKIDGKINAANTSPVVITQNSDAVIIQLPTGQNKSGITGEAWFYCSSNASKDRKVQLMLTANNQQVIAKKNLSKGNYQLKLSWHYDSVGYYAEQIVMIQ